ncbi:transcriptional regulator [Erwinia phyllosphaerae]|uniref:transcriptional regulator n=1 Tax=Erwinia phyllosphaerae TaxID=2853256 RepID=UPI001FF07C1C|nr:Cro/CI family transcriptional regulator [Erwinia phyllosphaerae]MBV4366258.1 helix-turn-helix domain-containing protein [Erwinia phyllosphaerae]
MNGLDKAIMHAGSQVKLAASLGIATQSVNRWLRKYEGKVPPERVIPIYRLTGVTPHELRPDLHPNPSDGLPPDHKHTESTQGNLNHENQQGS